jgi:hypothetical protein
MITCPKCSAQLPDWAQQCQFCQTDVRLVQRGATGERKVNYYEPKRWVVVAYNIVAGYFILSGILNVVSAIGSTHRVVMGQEIGFTFDTYLSIAFAVLTVAVGIGLILHVEIARGIVNFLCGMKIIFGLACAGFTILGATLMGPYGVLMIFMQALDIAMAGFMIYLIGETDRQGGF